MRPTLLWCSGAWHCRVAQLLVHVLLEIIIVKPEAAAEWTAGPRAIPNPKLEISCGILRLSVDLLARKLTPTPSHLRIQLCALQHGIRRCKSSFGTFCTDSCNQCGEKPAKTTNGECVRPMNLPSGQYYCPANRTTGTSCAMCYYDNPYIAKYTEENATTKTCYQNPDFQLPGYYRCSIHTGKWNVEKDVTHCATECFAIDPDSNKRYAKKIHQFNDNKPYRTCEQANKNSCVKNGMV